MAGLKGKTFCISGNGRGAIGEGICQGLAAEGAKRVDDVACPPAVDFAICTVGKIFIRDAGLIDDDELAALYDSNYLIPRQFTEAHIRSMRAVAKPGLILHIGSIAARYGNPGMEDYAAFKSALNKYLELRARTVRQDGIRLSVLNLGGVNTAFWDKAMATADTQLARQIMPQADAALQVSEVVDTVLSVLNLPSRVTMKDGLFVSVDYQ